MTILMSADCMGGVWTYALDLVRALPQHQFIVATMGDLPNDAQRATLVELPNAQLRALNFALEWMESPWDDVARAGTWLLELETEFAPALIHLNGFAHAVCPFRAPKIVVAHSCVLSWFRAVKGENAPAQWNCYHQKVAAGLRAANTVIFPTRALQREFAAIYGEFAPSQTIWNGSVSPPNQNIPVESFVLSAGRLWDEAKNVALLERIALQVGAPICVAGAGTLETCNVEALGFLPFAQMSEQMERAAIWAHPARYEPFGLAILEAANRNCALVLSDISTLRELWDGAAIFVAPDDENGWVAALNSLLDASDERDLWAARARERARSYNLERFGAAYGTLYDELT